MHIAIIDNEKTSREELKLLLQECVPSATLFTGCNGEDALLLLEKESIDVLFLDIQLNDINGTVLVSLIQRGYPNILIIFATAYEEYAAKAFDLNITDYITKPFSKKRLEQTIKKIIKAKLNRKELPLEFYNNLHNHKISVQTDRKIVILDIKNIIFIETCMRNLVIHTTNGDYLDTTSLNYYEKRLAQHSFYRTQKSFLVNLNYIEEIVPWFNGYGVKMKGIKDKILPIGRSQLKVLRKIFAF
ncbi:response regulator transcription factor [Sedimentibacter sp. zth1]|uniref:LytR/AlgR family response regulator transcription factor n=1 Tax=Sedimentibacter sp. zth1 TaxID=2816908 RepID=UPI001A92F297|nr:LytTR family DNA-binding domain-containing protein [Sedimentibacter sp. zth1]QSX04865.1 response regulator transcription factor [Sedimentibacter sp. zth1]